MINNRFIIKKKLGEGRSKVFLCADIDNPGKEYAIKILPENTDAEEIKIFRKEFFTLQNLNHPNIIISHEEGIVVKTDEETEINAGCRFITLDCFPGTELLKYEKINDGEILKIIIKQICSALYYLHQSNYIYYDLKPENILVKESEGKPNIKLIDMGFASHLPVSGDYVSKGTREYIAPEILKKEQHSHQADLYSFGIMLYRIVYGKFPFISGFDLEIYKEHIEREFEFPENNVSNELVEIIKKLLKKNPVDRFDNSLQVLKNIRTEIDQDTIKHFTPANIFTDRDETILQIQEYLSENKNKEVLVLQGAEGSGKTTLLYKIYSDYEKVILIGQAGSRSSIGFIQHMLKKIIFTDFIYAHLEKDLIEQTESVISGNSENLITGLKSIFTGISYKLKFNLIIDDFNLLDNFTLDIFSEILPILQVNGINIILSERIDHPSVAEKIINSFSAINLLPFTEDNLTEYLDKALATFFPKDQLKKLIIKYADLLPGSIISFIRDLILLKIIRFTYDGAEIIEDEKTEKLLEKSHEEIFRLRFSLLTPEEIKIAQFLSCFENSPESEIISGFTNLTLQEINNVLKGLEEKNIIQVSNIEVTLNFTSDSLKKYAYSTVRNKEAYHLKIADYISNSFKDYNRNELARQYELGEKFILSCKILMEEIDDAEKLSAYSYKKNLLNHLLHLPLPSEYQFELKYKLALTLSKLNDARSTLSIVEDLLTISEDENSKDELLILKGSSLIELGELEEGKNLLHKFVEQMAYEERKQKLLVEIAYAEFDLGNYEIAKKYCNEIIENINSSKEDKGKCYNLLGLIDTFLDSNFDGALINFQEAMQMYRDANLKLNVAKMEGNIGNTYNRKEDYLNAEKHWNNSLQINISIGNLDQEARILLSFGIFYYNNANFDKSIEQYGRAYNIFVSLGNRNGQGLVLTNLGETYLSGCEYQKALESFTKAKDIFRQLSDIEEKAEVIFMLAKLFYTIGDEKKLKETLYEFKILLEKNYLPERYNNNYKFIELISSFPEKKDKINNVVIENVVNDFREQNEGGFFAEGFIILSEFLIQGGVYELPFKMMNDDKFEKICDRNILYKAGKKYLLSELSSDNNISGVPPAVKFLEEAHDLIADEHITELTWKVLFSLGKNYYNRGNFKKANEYLLYSKEVINFIANNIDDNSLRTEYLSKPERKSAIEQIENMQQK